MLAQLEHRLRNHQPRTINAMLPKAAVLIPVTDHCIPELIFTRRASHMSTHSGEVAFPGGKKDHSDLNLVDTALRETEEEIGLARHNIRVLGKTGAIISRYGLEVTPVVGVVNRHAPLSANPDELDRIFQVPVDYFLDQENLLYDQLKLRERIYQMPSFWYEDYRIWGLTAIMLVEFLNVTMDAGIPLNAPQFSASFAQQTTIR